MAFERLSSLEQEIVFQCMRAAEAFIDDWEKHARLGLGSKQLRAVIDSWPHVRDNKEESEGFLAINNSLNEVCHGIHISTEDWGKWFDVPLSEVQSTYRKWRALKEIDGGIR